MFGSNCFQQTFGVLLEDSFSFLFVGSINSLPSGQFHAKTPGIRSAQREFQKTEFLRQFPQLRKCHLAISILANLKTKLNWQLE